MPMAPLTPPGCDLQDFRWMPLDVLRLRDSELASNETPEACWAAVLLWAASWHQIPAASVPNDDRWLAKAAGYLARGNIDPQWEQVRPGALRGFVECTDGRLYHPVVAAKACEAWSAKLRQRWSTECARIKKHNERHPGANVPKPSLDEWLKAGCPQGHALFVPGDTPPGPGDVPGEAPSKGQGEGEGQGEYSVPYGTGAAGAPPAVDNSEQPEQPEDPRRLAWRDCGQWLVAGGLAESTAREHMGKLVKTYPAVALEAMAVVARAPRALDPVAYMVGVARKLADAAAGHGANPTPTAEETAAELAKLAQAAASPSPEARQRIERLRAGVAS